MTKTRINQKKLDELKETIPHSQDADFAPEYAHHFAERSKEQICLYCGEMGTFTWGLAHGEGHCYICGYPARLYHFIKGPDDKETRIVKLLQYHPSELVLREKTP